MLHVPAVARECPLGGVPASGMYWMRASIACSHNQRLVLVTSELLIAYSAASVLKGSTASLALLMACVVRSIMPSPAVAQSTEPATSAATAVAPDVPESKEQRDARMKWWREARFGMFIHWGVYSVPAGVYQGKNVPSIGEWIMNTAQIPVAEYRKYVDQFNPTQFSADDIVKIAKD